MTDRDQSSNEDQDRLISPVPEPRRAALTQDLVEQLVRDEVDPELSRAARTLLGR